MVGDFVYDITMNSTDTINYRRKGFDFKKYISLQSKAILKRIEKFSKGRMYFEIGGKLLLDVHAARVLPGFEANAKVQILKHFEKKMDIIFCVNADDIKNNRMLSNIKQGYIFSTVNLIQTLRKTFKSELFVSINLVDGDNFEYAKEYKEYMAKFKIRAFFRYKIEGYPKSAKVLSLQGYGQDEYIPVTNSLVIVTGAASNSGKMSTCLGQIYLESLQETISGYAKYETFPIWNLPLDHPINIAYEAATADIGDHNMIDTLHHEHHNLMSVNYNRDVQAFKIVRDFNEKITDHTNYMNHYKSPTDMGISMAGFCITNDEICSIASLREIERRRDWYKQTKDIEAVKRCNELLEKAQRYFEDKNYVSNLAI